MTWLDLTWYVSSYMRQSNSIRGVELLLKFKYIKQECMIVERKVEQTVLMKCLCVKCLWASPLLSGTELMCVCVWRDDELKPPTEWMLEACPSHHSQPCVWHGRPEPSIKPSNGCCSSPHYITSLLQLSVSRRDVRYNKACARRAPIL